MDTSCNDVVFGVMHYKHRWIKKQTISAFGKAWEVTVAAKAYSGKPITKEQQGAYQRFSEKESIEIATIEKTILSYVNSNINDLSVEWVGARKISAIADLAQIVTPKTILFKQDGTTIMLLDGIWDTGAGLAVEIYPEVRIGSQDLFLECGQYTNATGNHDCRILLKGLFCDLTGNCIPERKTAHRAAEGCRDFF